MKFNLLFLVAAQMLFAEAPLLQNLDKNRLAIQGFDPVAFFSDQKPVLGKPEFELEYQGAVYRFATKQHRDIFKKQPAKYLPAFGGYCAYGLTKNQLVEIDVDAFEIVNGRLLLQYSKGIREDFDENRKGNLEKADANWAKMLHHRIK